MGWFGILIAILGVVAVSAMLIAFLLGAVATSRKTSKK
jgi:chromate transport protein ChrA